jgi:PA domain
MNAKLLSRTSIAALAAALWLGVSAVAFAAATIVIINADGAGEGFNDPTPVAPVGGNPGLTLGQQRLNAFQHAAGIWGATLTSSVTIRIEATFDPLTCTPTGAVLGAAGAADAAFDNSGLFLPVQNTWYPIALVEKIIGADISFPGDPDIFAFFNSNLNGNPGCLGGTKFYLGLDNNHGTDIDLVAVLLHEFGHGLGFSVLTTSGNTGARFAGLPSIWEGFMFDNTTGIAWLAMNDAERAASARNPRKVVWTGANVTAGAPSVLIPGTPQLVVASSVGGAGTYDVGAASFGPVLTAGGVSGDIMPVLPQAGGTGPGCEPFNALNALAVNGNIALIDRGVCTFPVKVKNAQNAGAKAVIIADNVAGAPPPGLGGSDPTITIPAVRITLADANIIKPALAFRSRTRSGVIGTLNLDLSRRAGADALGRVMLFTPNPYQPGSSVSHWDSSAIRNLLMEPAINADLSHSAIPPFDLTFPLLQDIGW